MTGQESEDAKNTAIIRGRGEGVGLNSMFLKYNNTVL